MHDPYISRPETEALEQALKITLHAPADRPLVFQIWGIGGVGKTTLTKRLKQLAEKDCRAKVAIISFGITEDIDDAIQLMGKLYEQLEKRDGWNQDAFWEKYELYWNTIHKLETEATKGWGTASSEQVGLVQQLLKAGRSFLPEAVKEVVTEDRLERGIETIAAGLSLKDNLQELLREHKATRKDQELQKLMLNPLPQLTEAFAQGLQRQAKQQPRILILDTYEKAPLEIDTWLWRTLLGNCGQNHLQDAAVRWVVAGRHSLLEREGWRKLNQDYGWVYDCDIQRFDQPQTQAYLTAIGYTNSSAIEQIFQVTKGLPYYLNWIRQERQKGREPDFSQGNMEIVRLLLQGLNDTQRRLVQLAACCRRFDRRLIRYLTAQQNLDFATAVDETQDCFSWLGQQSFVEFVQQNYRLDDVARDVFRQDLWQADRDCFAAVHEQLATYFQETADQEVPVDVSPRIRYENPDWRKLRAEFLYHTCFQRSADLQRHWRTHLLEGCYCRQNEVVQIPLQQLKSDGDLDSSSPLLNYATRQFLSQLSPTIEYSWLLENDPQDSIVDLLEILLGLTKAKIGTAIQICLKQPEQLSGLAKFAAFFYQAKWCSDSQRLNYLQKARAEAKGLGQDDPEFACELWCYSLGNRFADLEEYEEAIASYKEALKYKPDAHEAWNNRGNALFKSGRYEEAIASYDKALKCKHDAYEAWSNRGTALDELGRYEEAIVSYEEALKHKPDKHDVWNNQGVALFKLGRYEEAIVSYEEALKHKPDKHDAWNNQGIALGNLGRHEEAIVSFEEALKHKPDNHEAWHNRGVALFKLGRYEEAIVSYEEALKHKPDKHEAWYNRGIALDDLGRHEEAIASYDEALKHKPDKHEAWINKGYAWLRLGQPAKTLEHFEKAKDISGDEADFSFNKACLASILGNTEIALAELQRAIEADPKQYLERAKTNSDFDNIRKSNRFQALINTTE